MLKTFSKGGVHPPENKLSESIAIKILALPKTVSIPISQHIGSPATVIVKRREKVKVGQIIAKTSGFISANIHSSVSGTVTKIDKVMDGTGYKNTSIIIKVAGDDWMENIDKSQELKKDITLNSQQIIDKVLDCGIVGLGGATFPSHVKLSIPKGQKADVLIINGVECEPYLTADHRLMLEKGEEMMVGIEILKKALNVKRAIIGIENNKKDAISHIEKLCKNYDGSEVVSLQVKYPQGGEKQLIKAVINREVPSGGLPIHVGAVVHNVGTAFAVYEAIQKNKPLIERVVTVTGTPLKKTYNFMARIGVSLEEIIEASGGMPEDTGKIISGGPMMGKALNTIDVPMTKGTSGVLLIPKKDAKRRKIEVCIRCAKCVSVCPMGLEPYLLMTLTEKKMFENLEEEKTMDCIECGSCSYICPSNRPLLDYIRLGKLEVGKIMSKENNF
ncbi:MAG: electron transport complex subunit RsxC [Bacteroidetes bacterium 4572_128]|nr:MAG: electron transport complex subunit RsxC [Bacteroidetes bacterium 4572_128]